MSLEKICNNLPEFCAKMAQSTVDGAVAACSFPQESKSFLQHPLPEKLPTDDANDKDHRARRKPRLQLLQWKDMPRHLQFNPYIYSGYRPLMSVWGCLNSMFYLHNETINIFTHGKFVLK